MKKNITLALVCLAFNSATAGAAEIAQNTSPPPNGVMFTDAGVAKVSTTGDVVTCTNSNGAVMQSTPWAYMQLHNKVIDTIVLNGESAGGTTFYCKAATGDLQLLMVADQSTQTNEVRIWIDSGLIIDQKIDPTQWTTVEKDFLNPAQTDFMPHMVKSGENPTLTYHNTFSKGTYGNSFVLSYSNSN